MRHTRLGVLDWTRIEKQELILGCNPIHIKREMNYFDQILQNVSVVMGKVMGLIPNTHILIKLELPNAQLHKALHYNIIKTENKIVKLVFGCCAAHTNERRLKTCLSRHFSRELLYYFASLRICQSTLSHFVDVCVCVRVCVRASVCVVAQSANGAITEW